MDEDQRRALFAASGLLGQTIRPDLYPGEEKYFSENPHVAGMASDSGHIILNPKNPPNINQDAVARNEAFRLHLRKTGAVPSFKTTPDQERGFVNTEYANNPDALKSTIAARIYSQDPSAKATQDQTDWVVRYLLGTRSE